MMSRRGRPPKTRARSLNVLVDTSFLLPALGIEVENDVLDAIRLFTKGVEVLYIEAALLEAMWKVIRIVPREKLSRVELGVEAVRRTYKRLDPPPRAYIVAAEIYHRGHRDYINVLHYSTARELGIYFLTIDAELIENLERYGYKVEGIVLTPSQFREVVARIQGDSSSTSPR